LGGLEDQLLGEVVAIGLGGPPQIDHRQLDLAGRVDLLDGPAFPRREGGPEDLVAAHDLGQRPAQHGDLQGAAEPEGDLEVVGEVAAGRELVEDPDPLLREGQGERPAVPGDGADRRQLGHLPGGLRPLDGRGQLGHRAPLEDLHHRHLDPERLPHAGGETGDQQRMAAQLEEVVVDAHPLEAQQVAPDAGEHLLDRRAGRLEIGGDLQARVRGAARQRSAVHLAARGQRQLVHHREGRRDHPVRQPFLQRRPQLGRGRRRALAARGDEGHQALAAAAFVPEHHHGVAQPLGRPEGGLHLAELDPVAAHLDLVVGAPAEPQVAPREQAREVAGPVEPRPRLPGERVGDEALGGEVRAAEVAPGQAGAADQQLAVQAGGEQVEPGAGDEGPGVGDRPADRHRAGEPGPLGAGEAAMGADDGGLGGAVGVHQADAVAHPGAPGVQPVAQGLFAAEDHQPHVRREGEAGGLHLGDQLVPEGGGQVEHGDAEPPGLGEETVERRGHRIVAQHQRPPAGETGPDLLRAGVEADRGELQHAVPGADAVVLRHAPDVVGQGPVRHQDALGPAGGARGVDHIGEAAGIDLGQGLRELPPFDLGPVRVQPDDPRDGRQPVGQGALGEHDREPGVPGQEREALRRVARVHREVRAAGPEHPEHPDEHLRRAFHAQAHHLLGPEPPLEQPSRERPRTPFELGIGQVAGGRDDRERARRAGRLLGEELVDRRRRRAESAAAARGEQGRALPFRHQGEGAQGRVRTFEDSRQEPFDHGQDAPRGRLVEAGPVIVEPEMEAAPLRNDIEGQGEVVRLGEVGAGQAQPGAGPVSDGLDGVVLEDEQAVEERLPGQAGPLLDPFELAVLELPLLRLVLLEAGEPGVEPAGGIDLAPHRQHVDEQADHRLHPVQLRGTAGDDPAEGDLPRAGAAGESEPPDPLEQGVRRDPQPPGELLDPGAGLGGEGAAHLPRGHLQGTAGVAGAGAVEGEGRRSGEAGELAPPVLLGLRRILPAHPADVVTVGARARQGHLPPLPESVVEGDDVGHHPGHGPAVQDHVGEAPHQLPGTVRPAEEGDAGQRRLAEVESELLVFAQERGETRLPLRLRESAPVLLRPGQLHLAADDLQGLLAPLPDEEGAKGAMTVHDRLPGPAPRRRIQLALEGRHVLIEVDLRPVARQEEVQEHALLRGRQRIDVLHFLLAHHRPFNPRTPPARRGGRPDPPG
jgi:hypothetical protein